MTARRLRAGLVGMGSMGRNHARVLQSLPDVDLVGAVDPLLRDSGAAFPVFDSVAELLTREVDLCVVATPTATHEAVALELAEAGVSTLIEKPLSTTAKSALTIVEAFERSGTVGCVGHIERFNPALQSLRSRMLSGDIGPIYQIATRRQGPFPARIVDAGVVVDLATHDIDLTAWIAGSPYRTVSARTAFRSGRPHEDLMTVVGELANGIVVTHIVNWLSPFKERLTTVTGELGAFVADTLSADLTFFQNGSQLAEWDRVAAFRGVSEGHVTRYAIPKPEPLLTELQHLVAATRGEEAAVVTLREGLATVAIAEAVRESATSGRTLVVSP